ncbi:MAG: class I tRNA ligase family protein [Candidatus Nanoarchaeia archaeon]|nr:class I tRNA ligase family protein [Candidatus Nanoarchaeia archaeon]
MTKERRLITSALPYTNNVPHLGNIVGSHLPADIFARYNRLQGYQTIFIGGTDEHGTASEIAAQKYGITPRELCDFYYKIHKDIYDWFNISYDNFSRTSKPIHYKTTQEVIAKIHKNGYIIEKSISLPFCNECKRQLSDRYIEGTCPNCNN